MRQAPLPAAPFSSGALLAAASVPPFRAAGPESAWTRWSPAVIQAARVLAQMRNHGPSKAGLPQISTAGARHDATQLPNSDLPFALCPQFRRFYSVFERKPAPDLIRGGHRFA